MKRTTLLAVCVLVSLGAQAGSNSSSNVSGPGGPDGGHPPSPPPEAIAACKGKAEGTEVSFQSPKGETFTGVCRNFESQLAAMPKGGPGGQGGQPPSN